MDLAGRVAGARKKHGFTRRLHDLERVDEQAGGNAHRQAAGGGGRHPFMLLQDGRARGRERFLLRFHAPEEADGFFGEVVEIDLVGGEAGAEDAIEFGDRRAVGFPDAGEVGLTVQTRCGAGEIRLERDPIGS